MFRWCRASMNTCSKTCAPCQFIAFPDIFQMTHTVLCTICCINRCTIDFIRACTDQGREGFIIDLQLIISIFALCFQFCCCFNCFLLCTLNITEGKASIFIYCQFFIITRNFWQYIIRVGSILDQRIFSCISIACLLYTSPSPRDCS